MTEFGIKDVVKLAIEKAEANIAERDKADQIVALTSEYQQLLKNPSGSRIEGTQRVQHKARMATIGDKLRELGAEGWK